MPTEIPVLPEAMGVAATEPIPARSKPPTDIKVAQVKGMWAVVIEGRIATRCSEQDTALEYARRVQAGDLTALVPEKLPKEWPPFVPTERN